MSHFLQTFHTAVWPGDGQSVKFWAGSKLLNSRYPCKHRKGAFLGSQRPISRDSNVPLSSNFSHSCMARRRTIGEILGQLQGSKLEISLQTQERDHFGGSQRPISRDSNVPLSSNFPHSCMARRRTIGEILGRI